MEKKNYNYDAQLGGDTDDMELCNRYGIDQTLAYTPAINEAVRKSVREENVNDLIKGGYSRGQAMSIADKSYNDAVEAAKLMK